MGTMGVPRRRVAVTGVGFVTSLGNGRDRFWEAVLAEIEDDDNVVALDNGAILMGSDGKISEWYGKQQLLPLVEGFPYAQFLGLDPRKRVKSGPRRGYLGMLGNFSPGPGPTIFHVGQARIGVLVCYEGFYPRLARTYSLKGANVLAVQTNDYWWGHSVFPAWHARMAASRVQECDLPVVRAANSGISSLTDAQGHLVARTGFNEMRTLQVELSPRNGAPTFYARLGDWILGLVLIIPLMAWAWSSRARKAKAHALAELLPD